jgi:hypothetical protein
MTNNHANDDDQRNENDRQDNEVITDLEHGFLEMADRVRLLDERCGLAEIRVASGGVDDGVSFTLTHDRSRKYGLARFFRDGQGFARQRGLIDLDRVTG